MKECESRDPHPHRRKYGNGCNRVGYNPKVSNGITYYLVNMPNPYKKTYDGKRKMEVERVVCSVMIARKRVVRRWMHTPAQDSLQCNRPIPSCYDITRSFRAAVLPYTECRIRCSLPCMGVRSTQRAQPLTSRTSINKSRANTVRCRSHKPTSIARQPGSTGLPAVLSSSNRAEDGSQLGWFHSLQDPNSQFLDFPPRTAETTHRQI